MAKLLLGSNGLHEFGGADRDRTGDLKLAKLALSQLSYGPIQGAVFREQGSGCRFVPTHHPDF